MATQRKSRSSRGASRGAPQHSGSGVRWYAFGFLSGLFAAFLIYLVTLPADPADQKVAAAEAAAARPQPSYDFYTVLPEQNLDVDVDPADLPQRSDSTESVFLLQAGSFRQAEDADRRRAELLLLGLDPKVEETQGSNGRWFRVVLGPFESRSAMARARSLTAQQDIDTLLMQRKRG